MINRVANGEDLDVAYFTGAFRHYTARTQNNILWTLSELLEEYAPELLETLPEEYLQATTDGDAIYGVPTYFNKVQNQYWICRESVAEEAGINIEEVEDIQDVSDALYKIKQAFPNMNAISGSSRSLNVTYPGYALASTTTNICSF
jgi:putative aldouronate transport system substrate-binding protein